LLTSLQRSSHPTASRLRKGSATLGAYAGCETYDPAIPGRFSWSCGEQNSAVNRQAQRAAKGIYVRTKSRMELLTDELQAQRPPLYTQEHEEDPMLTTRRCL